MHSIPRKVKDDGFKSILGNPELFVQFLNDFIEIGLLKNIMPDDIEDITERFIMMGIDSKDGDTVKKINMKSKDPLYVIGITEHQQNVYFRMSFRFLQYCVFIWHDYEKEQNALYKGASELKNFKYPPIIPIVYYTGENKWTAPINFIEKIYFNDIFEKYIPKFEYILIDSNNYSQDDLIRNKDILSLFLIIDKIKRAEQISQLKDIPQEFLNEIEKNTPEHLKKLVREVVASFLIKLDIPNNDRDEVINMIMTRRFSEMFTLVDGYSVTETRQVAIAEIAIHMKTEGEPIEKIIKFIGLTREELETIYYDMNPENVVTYSKQKAYEKVIEIAKNALKEGLTIAFINKITGLDESIIQTLQDEVDFNK